MILSQEAFATAKASCSVLMAVFFKFFKDFIQNSLILRCLQLFHRSKLDFIMVTWYNLTNDFRRYQLWQKKSLF